MGGERNGREKGRGGGRGEKDRERVGRREEGEGGRGQGHGNGEWKGGRARGRMDGGRERAGPSHGCLFASKRLTGPPEPRRCHRPGRPARVPPRPPLTAWTLPFPVLSGPEPGPGCVALRMNRNPGEPGHRWAGPGPILVRAGLGAGTRVGRRGRVGRTRAGPGGPGGMYPNVAVEAAEPEVAAVHERHVAAGPAGSRSHDVTAT